MTDTSAAIDSSPVQRLNVADRLAAMAAETPNALAVVCPWRWSPGYAAKQVGISGAPYATTTFAELNADATRLARGLLAWGVPPGTRLALLVRPGIDFVALVFALLRAGMVSVLVDPGLGKRNLMRCLAEAEPEGFVAISLAHAARMLLRRKFPRARWNVTVGRRWFWGGLTLDELRMRDARSGSTELAEVSMLDIQHPASSIRHPTTSSSDPAAIIFTSGSTGPPKGVLYTHRMFDTQVAEIQSMYDIEPGGIDLACFPLFALFNSAMGVTTVLPEMDFSRPAKADPKRLLAAANDWRVTQAFASPAVWRAVGDYCAKSGDRIASLQQVFSCGAPVPAQVLRKTLACVAPGAQMHTPYGATECLPISTIEAAEVLGETASKTDRGAGVCVGRRFDSIDWRVIRIIDEPIDAMEDAEELPVGKIGELIVRGPQASPWYVTRTEANAFSKICGSRAEPSPAPADRLSAPKAGGEDAPAHFRLTGDSDFWHRTGDVGYLDAEGRFWYCGRKSDVIHWGSFTFYPAQCEAIFNACDRVKQCAVVPLGPKAVGKPALVVELYVDDPAYNSEPPAAELCQELRTYKDKHSLLKEIDHLFVCPQLPVDIRHNAKINREELSKWALERFWFRMAKS